MAGSLQWGAWNVGAVPHDWAYENGYLLRVTDGQLEEVLVTKRQTDDLFADVMFSVGRKIRGTQRWRMQLVYFAVRLFGKGVWIRGRRESQYEPRSLEELQVLYERAYENVDMGHRWGHRYVAQRLEPEARLSYSVGD